MSQLVITDTNTILVGPDLTPQVVTITGQGPQGPQGLRGPDPWDDPIQNVSAFGAVTVDYSLGKHIVLTLTGTITSLAVLNWPASGKIARATFEVLNPGGYDILSWTGVAWPGGVLPTLTHGGDDLFVLTTVTGGARIFGNVVGQDYSIP